MTNADAVLLAVAVLAYANDYDGYDVIATSAHHLHNYIHHLLLLFHQLYQYHLLAFVVFVNYNSYYHHLCYCYFWIMFALNKKEKETQKGHTMINKRQVQYYAIFNKKPDKIIQKSTYSLKNSWRLQYGICCFFFLNSPTSVLPITKWRFLSLFFLYFWIFKLRDLNVVTFVICTQK